MIQGLISDFTELYKAPTLETPSKKRYQQSRRSDRRLPTAHRSRVEPPMPPLSLLLLARWSVGDDVILQQAALSLARCRSVSCLVRGVVSDNDHLSHER